MHVQVSYKIVHLEKQFHIAKIYLNEMLFKKYFLPLFHHTILIFLNHISKRKVREKKEDRDDLILSISLLTRLALNDVIVQLGHCNHEE